MRVISSSGPLGTAVVVAAAADEMAVTGDVKIAAPMTVAILTDRPSHVAVAAAAIAATRPAGAAVTVSGATMMATVAAVVDPSGAHPLRPIVKVDRHRRRVARPGAVLIAVRHHVRRNETTFGAVKITMIEAAKVVEVAAAVAVVAAEADSASVVVAVVAAAVDVMVVAVMVVAETDGAPVVVEVDERHGATLLHHYHAFTTHLLDPNQVEMIRTAGARSRRSKTATADGAGHHRRQTSPARPAGAPSHPLVVVVAAAVADGAVVVRVVRQRHARLINRVAAAGAVRARHGKLQIHGALLHQVSSFYQRLENIRLT